MIDKKQKAELDDLIQRLMGVYNIPINDGCGPIDGKDVFTRKFDNLPLINGEAVNWLSHLKSQVEMMYGEIEELWKIEESAKEFLSSFSSNSKSSDTGNADEHDCGYCEAQDKLIEILKKNKVPVNIYDKYVDFDDPPQEQNKVTGDFKMSEKLRLHAAECGLPEWVIDSISSIAWDQGHSAGTDEVEIIAEEMIETFDINYKKSTFESRQPGSGW